MNDDVQFSEEVSLEGQTDPVEFSSLPDRGLLAEIQQMKKNQLWLEILQCFHIQSLDGDLPKNLSEQERSEILFAASHWCDKLHKKVRSKVSAEQTLDAYFWAFEQSDQFAEEAPKSFWAQSSDAYLYYELYLTLGNNLSKMIRNNHVDSSYNKKLGEYRGAAYEKAVNGFKRALSINRDNIKCWYRLAKIMSKEYSAFGYKKSNQDLVQLHAAIVSAYQKAIDLYEAAENKKPYKKTYAKAKYGLAAHMIDVIYDAVWFEKSLPYFRARKKIKLGVDDVGTTWHGIKWTLQDLAKANQFVDDVFAMVGYQQIPNDEQMSQIAQDQDPVFLPVYLYYRKAKMYYMMAAVYESGVRQVYKKRLNNEQLCLDKYDTYLNLSREYCERALEIRMRRIAAGFTDSGGIYPEARLLARIYLMNNNSKPDDLKTLLRKCRNDDGVMYYYAYACYLFDKENGKGPQRALQLFQELSQKARTSSLRTKAEKQFNAIKNAA